MTSTIITKNSATAGLAPSAGQLVQGELAVNVTDKKIYTLNSSGGVVLLSSGSEYDVPILIDVNSASEAFTVIQAGSGGAASFSNSGSGDAVVITNTGSGNSLLVEDSANPDATPFLINASGVVVTGHTASQTLAGDTYQYQINSGTPLAGVRWNAANTGPTNLLAKSRSATVGTNSIVSSDDALGTITFAGDDGAAFIPAASISAAVDGTPSTNDMLGRLVFSTTADGASTVTERLRLTSTGAIAINGASNYGTAGQALISAGDSAPVWTDQFLTITYIFSGGGNVLTAGDQGDLTIPFACTITEWTMLADVSGSAVIDIWKDTYANYPPTVADTITGSAKPTITTATKGQSSTLTGWTTTIAAGDTLRFNVDSATTITRVTLSLKVKRT